jgi:ABC-type transporter Mla MlaB component
VFHVLLEGEITEHSYELLQLRGQLEKKARRVVFDLAGIRRINSAGVHKLIRFLQVLEKSCRLEAERCSPAIVNQLNMLPELCRRMQVRSIIVPLECFDCCAEHEITYELSGDAEAPSIPEVPCDECNGKMVLAEPEDRYFAFLHG